MKKYDAVVLSGGGQRGIVELGVLHAAYENKVFVPEYTKEYAGTSIGSAINVLLSIGYLPMQIFSSIYTDSTLFTTSDLNNYQVLFSEFAILRMDSFLNKMRNMIIEKCGYIPTLQQIKNKYGVTLHITTARATTPCNEVHLSYKTHPRLLCLDAVERSCALPLVYNKVCHSSVMYVDGGLTNNFPVNYISKRCNNILGIVVSGDFRVPEDFTSSVNMHYFLNCIALPISSNTDLRCKMAGYDSRVDVVRIDTTRFPLFQLYPTYEDKMTMFLFGYNSVEFRMVLKCEKIRIEGWSSDSEEENLWDIEDIDIPCESSFSMD